MEFIKANLVLDAKGLACPMPVVKTKKAMSELEAGHVLEVQATDKGSKADLRAWSQRSGHQYLGLLENGKLLKHYIRKLSHDDKFEINYPHVVKNEELEERLRSNDSIVVLDVREEAEYAFGHIPGAISIPLGDLEGRLSELDKSAEIYVVCRTGNRSDFASQALSEKGFTNVKNVVPGMSQWKGQLAGISE